MTQAARTTWGYQPMHRPSSVTVMIRLPHDIHGEVLKLARERGTTKSEVVRDLVISGIRGRALMGMVSALLTPDDTAHGGS